MGNVIVPFDFKRAYGRLERLCGYPTEEIRRRLMGSGIVPRFETGAIGAQAFAEELRRVLEINLDYEEFRDLWNCIFLSDSPVPESLLAEIRTRYRLLLLSNTNP